VLHVTIEYSGIFTSQKAFDDERKVPLHTSDVVKRDFAAFGEAIAAALSKAEAVVEREAFASAVHVIQQIVNWRHAPGAAECPVIAFQGVLYADALDVKLNSVDGWAVRGEQVFLAAHGRGREHDTLQCSARDYF
jgi:hypothetical protein